MDSKPLDDEATAVALREAGIGVSEGISETDAMRDYMVKANATMRKQMKANEKQIKGLYVDWVFSKLNLVKYR